MTWGEFKAAVEAKGVTDGMVMDWIDINFVYVEDADDVGVTVVGGEVSIN